MKKNNTNMNELNSQKVRKLAPEKDLVQSKIVILSGGKDLVQYYLS